MSKENKHIDRIFKDGLSDFREQPPSHIWDSVENGLNNTNKQKKILIWWQGVSAAAILCLVFIGTLYWNNDSNLTSNTATEIDIKSDGQEIINETLINNNNTNHQTSNENSNNITASVNGTLTTEFNAKADKFMTQQQKESKQENKDAVEVPSEKLSDIHFMQAKEIESIHSHSTISVSDFSIIENKESVVQKKEYLPLFANQVLPEKEKQKMQFYLGGQFSPTYSYSSPSASENEANEESGLKSIAGGINLGIKTSKRLRIETGVYYSQVGQKFSNTTQANVRSVAANLFTNGDVIKPDVNLNNSLGKIVLDHPEDKLMAQPSPERNVLLDSESAVYSYTKEYTLNIQQELDYIEVPLLLKYALINKNINLSLTGGFSTNFLVGNNAYNVNDSKKSRIGKMADINTISYSTTLGFSLKTPLYKSLEFNIEPKIRYFLNSVSSSKSYDFTPYSFGVFTGVSYKF